ncbi:phosphotransferase family protein [Paenibacillus sp. GCM10012303]|uniref:phosphotransferase family protein n=1 Tax=Paenibacillus sp. GCM10012303 TaxID=3317340 RepID=UPI00360F9922
MQSTEPTLSDHALKWVVDAVHPEAEVLSVERLFGGVSSPVHGVSLRVDGEVRYFVLRQIDNKEWLQEQPDLVVREAESLRRAAEAAGVRIPAVVAFDETGSRCGTGLPALLMTRLEGKVVLEPEDRFAWLNGMAQALIQIHDVKAGDFPWAFAPYCNAASLDTSSWSKVPDLWRTAAGIVTSERPAFAARFIHRDFHPANVLWSGGAVSGVVDWVNGCIGPAGVDVGHCRVNLALLYDVRTADEFLTLYRQHAVDSFAYDPYWDLVTLIDFAYWPPEVYGGWTALGMKGLTTEMMIERLDAYLISLLDRVSETKA